MTEAVYPDLDKLTKLQRRVAEEYVVDLNQAAAYRRAKGRAKNAAAAASEILSNPNAEAYVAWLKQQMAKNTRIDAEYMLKRLFADIEADVSELYDDTGKLKPVRQWPEVWRKGLVEGIETDKDGNVLKVKIASRTKLKQMLGDHTDVQAFMRNMNLTMDDSLADRIARARERAQKKADEK